MTPSGLKCIIGEILNFGPSEVHATPEQQGRPLFLVSFFLLLLVSPHNKNHSRNSQRYKDSNKTKKWPPPLNGHLYFRLVRVLKLYRGFILTKKEILTQKQFGDPLVALFVENIRSRPAKSI